MNITEQRKGDIVILELDGGLGYDNHKEFTERVDRLIDEGAKHLILDLERLVYLSSWGIGSLLSASAKIHKLDGSVKLANVHREITHILSVMQLMKVFDICETVDDGIREIERARRTAEKPPTET